MVTKTRFLFLLSLVSISFPAWAGPAYDYLVKGLPKEVVDVVDRRIGCTHWEGEMPSASESEEFRKSGRTQIIEKNLKNLKCKQLNADEKIIRKKYKGNDKALNALDESRRLRPNE